MNQKQLLDLLARQTSVLERLVPESQGKSLQTKAPAGIGTFTPLHGHNGIFSDPAQERDVVTSHVRPQGIGSTLPLLPSVLLYPLFPALTGYTDVSGTEPTRACEDAPNAFVKSANITARFGLLRRDSQEIDLTKTFLRLNRGEHSDFALRGRVLGLDNLQPSDIQDSSEMLNLVSLSEMVNVGVQLERALSVRMWQGDPTQGQFPGLDSQIATGIVDAITNTPVPSLDSDVKDFGYDLVDGNGRDIVEYLSMMEFYLRHNATTMGLDPVDWVIAMRPGLWFELSAVWPCQYNTHRCGDAVSGNSRVIVDGRENVAERDLMRNNMFIDINGNRYPVITDTGIFEHNSTNNANITVAGEFASSIYFVPRSIVGNMPSTYREYKDFRQAQPDLSMTQDRLDVWWTDNGVYSWSLTQEKWCYIFHALTEQRIVLRTPHLAGKLQNVRYSPLQHLRDPYPDSPYHYDGGVSVLPNDPKYKSVWL